ncbi:MAG: GNAT family N-acetyltransferase [Jatrophihabitantaceae bacterium]
MSVTTVRWQPLSTETVTAWAELTNLLAVVDGTDEFYEPEALAEELTEPGVDPELDTVGAWRDGVLVGFGQLRVASGLSEGQARAEIYGGVRPEFRRQGLGAEIMNRMEPRALELTGQRHPGVPVMLRVPGGVEGASVRPMLERRGYSVVRYYHELSRPIPGVLPPPPELPVRRYSAELAEAVRLAHNDAFSTHWGSIERDADSWASLVGSRTFRPDCSFVSLASDDDSDGDDSDGSDGGGASDGGVQAYVLVSQWVAGEAWVGLVGTRQRARGRGLARACLAASVRAMAEQGYDRACLGVDSQNGSGAGALYASLGFQLDRVIAHYGRLEPAR